ncbi:taste receptor type 2 member 39-like [Hyla sarda]|uniref:taste receptor type 2 member 39-like n=1 Tax=Hyla sarda TaxID=327740 RepID=UPI0024C25619|nr:taste receptor type 2 member 39-like [Hyla sarda]
MEFSTRYFLLAVFYMICLVGFTVNMIMVAANLMKWKNLRSLPTYNKILSSLASSRALDFLTFIINNSINVFFPWLLKNNVVMLTLNMEIMFVFCSSLWLATLLCVFYCVKIVTYNYKLFIFLKTRISTMVPWLILSSLLISLISSLIYAWYSYDLKLQNLSNGSTGNMAGYELVAVPNYNNKFLLFSLGSIPPFLILCVSISLLIHFLLIHTRRMRSNESHTQSPNLKSHFGALKSMSLFLVLQIMYVIFLITYNSHTFLYVKHSAQISSLIPCSLQLLHSLYMISSSSEVKKMFPSALCFSR